MPHPARRPAANATWAPLVLDALADDTVPRLSALAAVGTPPLRLAGCGQPSAPALRAFIAAATAPVWVVDLRQESHGFLNDHAVSWYAENNWGAVGLDAAEAQALEGLRLKLLRGAEEVAVNTKARLKAGLAAEVRWAVARVQSEAEVVTEAGARYLRVPVSDHMAPSAQAHQRLIEGLAGVPAAATVLIHCRGGKGRTATAMTLLDLARGGRNEPLEAAFARQRARTGYDLTASPAPGLAKAPYLAERLAFLVRCHAGDLVPVP